MGQRNPTNRALEGVPRCLYIQDGDRNPLNNNAPAPVDAQGPNAPIVDHNAPPPEALEALETLRQSVSFAPLPQHENADTGTPFLIPKPVNGFPTIHKKSPKSNWAGVPQGQQEVWIANPSGKALTTVHGMSAHPNEANRTEILTFIPAMINKVFRITTAKLAAPEITLDDRNKPIVYLLYGLPKSVEKAVIHQGTFAFQKFQFSCHPLEDSIPHLLCTLKDLVPSFVEDEDQVLALINAQLWNETMMNALLNVASQIPGTRDLPSNQAIRKMTTGLKVEIVWEKAQGGVPKPIVNIICPPPTTDAAVWEEFRNIFGHTSFNNGLSGIGTLDDSNRSCNHCHAQGHYQGLCPFTKIRNWPFDPNKESARDANSSSRNDRGRSGNNRGGGRGRGNRGNQGRGRNY